MNEETGMNIPSQESRTGVLISPKIVRAWFDTVLNPILSGLRTQKQYLSAGNLTWRFRGLQFEVIVSAHSYIDIRYWDNYEHLIAYHPDLQNQLLGYDNLWAELQNACEQLQFGLESNGRLTALYKQYTQPDVLARLNTNLQQMFGGYPDADHVRYLAQLIINRTGDLPDHYTVHPLWNAYRDEFMALLDAPENQALDAAVREAAAKLLAYNEELTRYLKELRLELANKSGEPIVISQAAND